MSEDIISERPSIDFAPIREGWFRTIVDHSPVKLWAVGKDGVLIAVLGASNPTVQVGVRFEEAFAENAAVLENHRRALAGETFTVTIEYRDAIYDAWYSPLRGEGGEIEGMIGVAVDVSSREGSMRAVRNSEALNRRILESVPSGIVQVSSNGAIIRANETAKDFLGLTYEELTSRYVGDFGSDTIREDGTPVPPDEHPVRRCLATRAAQPPMTIGVRRSNGDLFWGVFSAFPLDDAVTGEPLGAVLTFVDITERKRHEDERARLLRELSEVQKLDALGRLAGGITHDFNNVLGAIMGHAGVLKNRAAPGSDEREAAEVIELAAVRGASLTRQLLGFARRGKYHDVPFDLNRVIRDTISLLARTIDKKIVLSSEGLGAPALMSGDPGQVQQVLVNLALNARDAMPQGGQTRFRVERIELTGARAQAPGSRAGKFLRLSVSDTGTGIPAEVRPRIFEPFFTTKRQGEGIGMGLAMVYGIVDNHGGWTTLESEEGVGTTFQIHFPALDAKLEEEAVAIAPSRPHRRVRVLVVDDEEILRKSSRAQLTALGCDVELAASSEEAIELYRRADPKFDVVFLDLNMPVVDGSACFRRLKALDPDVAVVLTTGYGQNEVVQRVLAEGARAFLPKPYMDSSIEDALNRCLAVRGPAG